MKIEPKKTTKELKFEADIKKVDVEIKAMRAKQLTNLEKEKPLYTINRGQYPLETAQKMMDATAKKAGFAKHSLVDQDDSNWYFKLYQFITPPKVKGGTNGKL